MLNTFNAGLQACSCGLTLNFNNPSGEIPKKDEYFLEFKLDSSLPTNANTVTLSPESYVISGSNNFIPQVVARVKSIHRGETQSLIRLTIKDRYNKQLYTDYIRLVCSPVATVTLKGSIIRATTTAGLGPNGFTTMSVVSTQDLDVGMMITGPGIDSTTGPVYVHGILSESLIELSAVLDNIGDNFGTFNYTFTRTTSCVDPESRIRQLQSQNLVLDKTNNWTHISNDRFIIKFIRENQNDEDIVVVIPSVNKTLLSDIKKDSIPTVSNISVIGRVSNDQYCIT